MAVLLGPASLSGSGPCQAKPGLLKLNDVLLHEDCEWHDWIRDKEAQGAKGDLLPIDPRLPPHRLAELTRTILTFFQMHCANVPTDADGGFAWLRGLRVQGPETVLRALSLSLQEDFGLMANLDGHGLCAVALSVCFPGGWNPNEKIGTSMHALHEPAASTDEIRAFQQITDCVCAILLFHIKRPLGPQRVIPMHSRTSAGVLLTAGRGRRLGGINKGRLLVNGKPLLIQQLQAMSQAGLQQAMVVLGAQADQVAELLKSHGPHFGHMTVQTTIIPQHQLHDDAHASAEWGLRAMAQPIEHDVFISLADLPLITAAHYARLQEYADQQCTDMVIPQHPSGATGHPILIQVQGVNSLLGTLHGQTLRAWLRRYATAASMMASHEPAYFTDLDTTTDMAQLQNAHGLTIAVPVGQAPDTCCRKPLA